MADVDWGLYDPNSFSTGQQQGSDFVDKMVNLRAQSQAAQAYAAGDYAGGANAYLRAGDIANAQKLRGIGAGYQAADAIGRGDLSGAASAYAGAGDPEQALKFTEADQKNKAARLQVAARAVPYFRQSLADPAQHPLDQIFDNVVAGLSAAGYSAPEIDKMRASFKANPNGFTNGLAAMIPADYKTVKGDEIVTDVAHPGSPPVAQGPGEPPKTVGYDQGEEHVTEFYDGNKLTRTVRAPRNQPVVQTVDDQGNPTWALRSSAPGLAAPPRAGATERYNFVQLTDKDGTNLGLGRTGTRSGNIQMMDENGDWVAGPPGVTAVRLSQDPNAVGAAADARAKAEAANPTIAQQSAVQNRVILPTGETNQPYVDARRALTATNLTPEAVKSGALYLGQTGQYPLSARDRATQAAIYNEFVRSKPQGVPDEEWQGGLKNAIIAMNAQKQAAAATGKSQAFTIINENTVNNSIKILKGLLDKNVAGTAGLVSLNDAGQWMARQTNDKDAVNLKNAIAAISSEYARVMTGQTGGAASSDRARDEAAERILLGYSKGTMLADVAQLQQEMAGRSASYADALNQFTGGKYGGIQPQSTAGPPAAVPGVGGKNIDSLVNKWLQR